MSESFLAIFGLVNKWISNGRIILVGLSSKKKSEKSNQMTPREAEELGGPKMSYTHAKFFCQNVQDPSREAFLRIYRQVPHLGTEGDPHTVRAKQAGIRTHGDIEAYKWFSEKQAKHMPICFGG
jgi:hypothetical protein